MKITEKIFNVETNEETIIEREMNAEELADWETKRIWIEAELEAKAKNDAARTALLERLGITEDEARLLLGGN
jgi:hypothetical protein